MKISIKNQEIALSPVKTYLNKKTTNRQQAYWQPMMRLPQFVPAFASLLLPTRLFMSLEMTDVC